MPMSAACISASISACKGAIATSTMKAGLQLRTAQNLSLTPQLQQSIRLLQLSTLEMQQEVEQMLADNPFLERETEAEGLEQEAPPAPDTPGEADWPDAAQAAEGMEGGALPDTSEVLADQATRFDALSEQSDNWNERADLEPGQRPASSDDARDPASEGADDTWDGMHATSGSAGATDDDDEGSAVEREGEHESLHAWLHRQALTLRLGDEDRAALYFVIESLNDDGYLEDSLGELAQSLLGSQGAMGAEEAEEALSGLLHHLTVALRLLQTLDPVGVGARNLAECLQLQLKALPIPDADTAALLSREVALDICRQPLDYLARRDVRGLGKLLPYGAAHIKAAMQLIATLEPKPGRQFADVERNIIVPDVLVQANAGRDAQQRPWVVSLNPAILPRVRVQEMYASALRQYKGEGAQALQQRLQEARWMVKSIQQRFDTILRVSTAIVERQQRFFEEGALAMEPLVLREIADELGLHESTVSRVTSAKYMRTPWGTFELKYFFGSGLATEDGTATSSTAVRAMLEKLIAEEAPQKPLSDNRLCELLQQQGIQCARRTVAKYREAMRIPPAHLRKTLG